MHIKTKPLYSEQITKTILDTVKIHFSFIKSFNVF